MEPQDTGRKRDRSDPEGVDSEPGNSIHTCTCTCSYQLVSAASSPTFADSQDSTKLPHNLSVVTMGRGAHIKFNNISCLCIYSTQD